MTKEQFIDLVQVSPIGLDSKRAQDIAEKQSKIEWILGNYLWLYIKFIHQ